MSELVAKRLMDAASSFLKRRTRGRAIRECAYVACLINLNKSRGNDCLLTRHGSHRKQLMIHVSGRQYADNSSGWVARCVNGNFHFLATRRRDNRLLKEILPLLISSCRTLIALFPLRKTRMRDILRTHLFKDPISRACQERDP